VFSSTPIVVKGRYTKAGPSRIVVNGNLRGKPWSRTINVNFPTQNSATGTQTDAVRVLWARTKLQDLQTNVYAGQVNTEAVTSVALEHRLMSEYTSFVAVDESATSNLPQQTVPVPAAEPDGVATSTTKSDSFVSYYKTVTPRKRMAPLGSSFGRSNVYPNQVAHQFQSEPEAETKNMAKSIAPASPQLQIPTVVGEMEAGGRAQWRASETVAGAAAPAYDATNLPAPASDERFKSPMLDKSFGMEETAKSTISTSAVRSPTTQNDTPAPPSSGGALEVFGAPSGLKPGFPLTSVLLMTFLALATIVGGIMLWLRQRQK
jgi:hypothetical protein